MKISHSVTTIQGGYNAQPQTAQCIDYGVDGVFYKYVALDKNAKWFLKGVGGTKASKGDLKPVQVLQIIPGRFNKAAVAEEAEEVDPMDAMEALPEKKVVTLKKKEQADPWLRL